MSQAPLGGAGTRALLPEIDFVPPTVSLLVLALTLAAGRIERIRSKAASPIRARSPRKSPLRRIRASKASGRGASKRKTKAGRKPQ